MRYIVINPSELKITTMLTYFKFTIRQWPSNLKGKDCWSVFAYKVTPEGKQVSNSMPIMPPFIAKSHATFCKKWAEGLATWEIEQLQKATQGLLCRWVDVLIRPSEYKEIY